MRRILVSGALASVLFSVFVPGSPTASAAVSSPSASGSVKADFNGDGFGDLAVGVPRENFAATDDGGVNVIYGSSTGLSEAGDQFWSQNSPGIQGGAESGDRFGSSLAVGDFNGDLRDDLAVGVPLENFAATDDGGVNVIYGPLGFHVVGAQFLSQNSAGIPGGAESGDRFGSSLAAADFGMSTHADLAVGVPGENFAGGVNVIYGPLIFTEIGAQFWSQNSPGIKEAAESGELFGLSLAAADFGTSTHADLAVGVPLENFAATHDGGVNVIYGSSLGLSEVGDQFWSQNSVGIQGGAESNDVFGATLAAADFGTSTHADLAVGVPLENFAATDDGGVNVIYGSSTGLTEAGDQFWSQNSPGIQGGAESDDTFGGTLAASRT
jgi:FG-GAP repeat